MEDHSPYLDGTADMCSIILSTDADDAPLFDLSGPSFSGLELSPSRSEGGRAQQAAASKPQEFLRDATWRSLAEAHEDHQQLRSTLHRAGQLCSSGSASSGLLDTFASRNEYRSGSSLLEAVNELPELGSSSFPRNHSEFGHMPETMRAEIRSIVSEAVNTMGGHMISVRSAMQDHLLEHSSVHSNAVYGVKSECAQMSTDVKEMRSVMSGMRSIILEAFAEMAIEMRKAIPATVADLKEEIGSMRDLMLKFFQQRSNRLGSDSFADHHAEHGEIAEEDDERRLSVAVAAQRGVDASEEEPAANRECPGVAASISNEELTKLLAVIGEAAEHHRAQQVQLVGVSQEGVFGSDWPQALRDDLRASSLALETLSQHLVEQHMVLHDIKQELTQQHQAVRGCSSWEVDLDGPSEHVNVPPETADAIAPAASVAGHSAADEVECPEATPFQKQGVDGQSLLAVPAQYLPQSQASEQTEVTPFTACEMSNLCSAVAEALAQQSVVLDDIRGKLSQDDHNETSTIEKLLGTNSAVLDAFVQQHAILQDLHEKSSLDLPGVPSIVKELIDTHSTVHESVVQQSAALDSLRAELPSSMSMMTNMHSQLLREVSKLGQYQDELIQDVQHERPEVLATLKTEVNRVLFEQLRDVRSDVSRDVRSEMSEGVARINSVVLEAIKHLTALQEEIMHALQPERHDGAPDIKEALADLHSMLQDRLSQHRQEQYEFQDILRQAEPQKDATSAVMAEFAGLHSKVCSALGDHQLWQEKAQCDTRSEFQEVSVRMRSALSEELVKHHAQLDQVGSELRQEQHAALGIMKKDIAELQSGLLQEMFKHHSAQDEFLRNLRQEREAVAASAKEAEPQRDALHAAMAEMAELAGLHSKVSTALDNHHSWHEQAHFEMRSEIQDVLACVRSALLEGFMKHHAQLDKASNELQQEHHASLSVMRKELADLQSALLQEFFKHQRVQDEFLRDLRQEREVAAEAAKENIEGMRSSIVHESIGHQKIVQDDIGRELIGIRSMLEEIVRQKACIRIPDQPRETSEQALDSTQRMGVRSDTTNERHDSPGGVCTPAHTEDLENLRNAVLEVFGEQQHTVQGVARAQEQYSHEVESIRVELANMQSCMLEPLSELKLTLDNVSKSLHQECAEDASTMGDSVRRVLEECLEDDQQRKDQQSVQTFGEVRDLQSTFEVSATSLQQQTMLDQVFQILLVEQTEVKRITHEMADMRSTVTEAIRNIVPLFQEELKGVCRLVKDSQHHDKSADREAEEVLKASAIANRDVLDQPDILHKHITSMSEKIGRTTEMTHEELRNMNSALLEALSQQARILESMSSTMNSDLLKCQVTLLDKLKEQDQLLYSFGNNPMQQASGLQAASSADLKAMHLMMNEVLAEHKSALETGVQKVSQCPATAEQLKHEVASIRSGMLEAFTQQNRILQDSLNVLRKECIELTTAKKDTNQPARRDEVAQPEVCKSLLDPQESDMAFEEIKRMCNAVLETHAQHKFLLEDVPSSVKTGCSEVTSALKGEVQTHSAALDKIFEKIEKTHAEVGSTQAELISMHTGMLEAMAKIGECPEMIVRLEHELSNVRLAVLETISYQTGCLKSECSELSTALKDEAASIRSMMFNTDGATQADVKAMQSEILKALDDQKMVLDTRFQKMGECPDILTRLQHEVETILSNMPVAAPWQNPSLEGEVASLRAMVENVQREGSPSLEGAVQPDSTTIYSRELETASAASGQKALLDSDAQNMQECPELLTRIENEMATLRSALLEVVSQQSIALEAVPVSMTAAVKGEMASVFAMVETIQQDVTRIEATGQEILKGIPPGLLEAVGKFREELLVFGVQNMSDCSGALARLEHDVANIQSTTLEAVTQQATMMESIPASLRTECSGACAGMISQIESLCATIASTDQTTQGDLKAVQAGLEQAFSEQKEILEAGFQQQGVCSETLTRLEQKLETILSTMPQVQCSKVFGNLHAGFQKMGECPETLARLEHDVGILQSTILQAISQQKTVVEGFLSSLTKENGEASSALKVEVESLRATVESIQRDLPNIGAAIQADVEEMKHSDSRHTEILRMMSEDVATMHSSQFQKLKEHQMHVLDGLSNVNKEVTSDTVKTLIVQLKEVQSGILQAMTAQANSLDAGIQKLELSFSECPEALSRIRAAMDLNMESAQAAVLEELTEMRSMLMGLSGQHQSSLNDMSDHIRHASESVAASSEEGTATMSSILKEQQILLNDLREGMLSISSEAVAGMKVEFLDMRSRLLDLVTQKLQADPDRPSTEQNQQMLTQIEGELARLQSACLEALGEQKLKLEEICSSMSSVKADEHDAARVEEAHRDAHAQFAEALKAEVTDIRTMLSEVLAHQNLKDDDHGREMRTKIQDGLTNMFSMVLEALSRLTLLQDEVMRGLQSEHPRKALITSSGEFIDVRSVVEEVLDQYSALKEELGTETKMVQAELKQMTAKMTEACDRQKLALDSMALGTSKRREAEQTSPESSASSKKLFAEEVQGQAVAAAKEELLRVRSMILEALAQLHGEHDQLGRELRSILEDGFARLRGESPENLAQRKSKRKSAPEALVSAAAEGAEESSSFSKLFF